jgi:hypothetical protein
MLLVSTILLWRHPDESLFVIGTVAILLVSSESTTPGTP